MRNNDVVRAFKVRLVKAFSVLRELQRAQLPKTFSEALYMAAQKQELIEKQQASLEVAVPKAKALSVFAKQPQCYS